MNKKAVSIMIGYVLLIAGIIIISAVVYMWMRSYVPREAPECPDGVSLFIEDSACKDLGEGEYVLNVSIKNNGRFDIDGYFIKATKTQEQEVATFDISEGITSGGNAQASVVLFPGGKLEPGNSAGVAEYDLDFPIYLVEVTPIRYETIEGKNKLVSCGNAIIKEKITC